MATLTHRCLNILGLKVIFKTCMMALSFINLIRWVNIKVASHFCYFGEVILVIFLTMGKLDQNDHF